MRKRDIPQALNRQYALDSLAHQRKHLARARVKKHRCVINDQILVERESARHDAWRQRRIYPINAVGNLINVGSGLAVCCSHMFSCPLELGSTPSQCLSSTTVAPAPPWSGGAATKRATCGWPSSNSPITRRNAPVPWPWMMRISLKPFKNA